MCWHANNIKISHRGKTTLNEFAMALADEFRPNTTFSRGEVHDYLGVDPDCGTFPGTFIISMVKYL